MSATATLTPQQRSHIARGLDKRCYLLTVPANSRVDFRPDGVEVEPPAFGPSFRPLPKGYRVRNKLESSPDNTLPDSHTAYYIQHESFPWVGEGQPYPLVKLTEA